MKEELALLRAELYAQKVVTFKLFEALLFAQPSVAHKLLVYLDGFTQELQEEPEPESRQQAQAVDSYMRLLLQAHLTRESALIMREALRAAKSGPGKPDAA